MTYYPFWVVFRPGHFILHSSHSKKLNLLEDSLPGLKFSIENENFKRAMYSGPFSCGNSQTEGQD